MTTSQDNPRSAFPPENLRCPYVGLVDDVNTYSEFPSDMNYCHRSQPITLPILVHQREYCLSARYSECPMLSTTKFKKLPPELRLVKALPQKPKLPRWLSPVVILAVFLLGSLATLIIPELSSAFASFLNANQTPARYPSPTPALTRLGFITPSPFSLFSVVKTFTPSAELPVDFTDTPTPIAAIASTPTPTPPPLCSAEDIKYFSISFFIGDVVQIVFTSPVDLRAYQVLDAQGKPTDRLNLPDFKLWRNETRVYSYGTFMRNPAEPTRLSLELLSKKNDKIKLSFIDETGTHCSKTITVPDENAFKTPTSRNPLPTQFIPSPTIAPPTEEPPTQEPPTPEPSPTPIPPTPTRTPRPSETLPRDTLTPTPLP